MGITDDAEKWLATVAVKKAVYAGAKGLVGILAATKAQTIMQTLGINIDLLKFQEGIATLTFAALEVVHDWLKVRYPNQTWL